MKECVICCQNVTEKSVTVCPFCDFECCKNCIQKYSLELTDDLNCMSCHRNFDRSTQRKMFTKVFIEKTYKNRREEVLFQRENALLPSTQVAISIEKRRRSIQKEIELWRNEHAKKLNEIARIQKRINDLSNFMYSNRMNTDDDDMASASTFVLRCSHENCKGFVSRAYKCGTCLKYTCPDCHEPKDGRFDQLHVCDENKKQNIAAIQRDCKPCISCGTQIFKTEGCPQMFCTQCNILFDWNTGRRISHSSGHNPHFIHWLRESGRTARDVGDVMCGGIPDVRTIVDRLKVKHDSTTAINISIIVRTLLHIHHYERPRYPISWNNDATSEQLRVKWSLGDYTDQEFKVLLQRHEKKNLVKKEIGLVLEMVVNSATDIFQRFVFEEFPTKASEQYQKHEELFMELENIRRFASENFDLISKDFSVKTPQIKENWDYVSKF